MFVSPICLNFGFFSTVNPKKLGIPEKWDRGAREPKGSHLGFHFGSHLGSPIPPSHFFGMPKRLTLRFFVSPLSDTGII